MVIVRAYNLFLKDRSAYCSAKTIETYSGHLKIFFDYLEQTYASVATLDFEDIPADDNIFSDYILHLRQQRTVSNVTIRSYARSIKAFLNFCYQEDLCRDFLKGVKLPKSDAVPPEPLLQDEVLRLDKCFDDSLMGLRNYCIVHLMLDCGLRSQEVLHLQMEHVDAAHNLLHIRISDDLPAFET